jgi:hypothetical protein
MTNAKEEEQINIEIGSALFDRYWDIFKNLDNRRIKSFFHLFYFTVAILLLAINPGKSFTIPFFDYVVDFYQAVLIAPLIISILIIRYEFLSSLTLSTQQKHNTYWRFFRSKLSEKYGIEPDTLDSFRTYELSELPNLFMIPIKTDASETFGKAIRYSTRPIFNLGYIALNIFPILIYLWLVLDQFSYVPKEINIFFIGDIKLLYIIIVVLLILSFVYFWGKTKYSRAQLLNPEDAKSFR